MNNIPESISVKLDRGLHNQSNHPIKIIKDKIYEYFKSINTNNDLKMFDDLKSIVNIENNFDLLLIPKEHPSRSLSDTYYYSETQVLRTHTSAHQNDLLKDGHKHFLVTGDVYRRDAIDKTHYPVFHQMEGVKIVEDGVDAVEDLKKVLSGLIEFLFPGCEYRFNSDYFPFTDPSFEVEVKYEDRWMEVLGCGKIQQQILNNCGLENSVGWAFGLGLERLAMVFFTIPDIRYFWSTDERFLNQFEDGKISVFEPYSKYPSVFRDYAFWVDPSFFEENGFFELIRNIGGDLVENVTLIDEFTNSKTQKQSRCYRILFQSHERSLTSEEINLLHETIRSQTEQKFNVESR